MTALPDPSAPQFLEKMREFDASLTKPEKHYRKLLKTKPRLPHAERFAALYGLLHRLRREARFPEFAELVRKYETEFSSEPLFDTFRVTKAKWTADDARSLKEALEPAMRALKAFPDEPGVLHSYAELVATLAEMDSGTSAAELERALKSVNRAISLSSRKNANHFSTRARIMLLKGDYRSARADVATAISLEDSSGADFLRRITRYEGIRSMIAIRRSYDEFASKQNRLLAELNSFRREQLQLLGLLAAIIALLVGGITLSTRLDPDDASRLVLLSAGAVAIVFAGLSSLLAHASWARVTLSMGVGAGLIATALWVLP
ncbi:tetratricopeptide (TPR) repeat protein [Microbacteriaceae bacterium SG_E_30_P1]|uniref:Tetratricopeptide (TPR) repeat protein n=1 Tax=Antiquaquibacter oligotrophicus TaxID=2880260 RepID=A0ABT6KL82_9MICO|nr:hypothetical protein [Antiquaquibacter oligotrophicus]MDH6180751.1 tetratricopeptide (TPR) repeat protein [Antiquaquibacter oligotrophicus]UDF13526.1 hypothetical protein LH407_01330 [Antiquaquibacter oligotrophicus]